jgi:purine-cytosine permease-like protein
MDQRTRWSRLLIVVGGLAMLVGTADPLEGSLLILPGSGLVALGMFLGRRDRRTIRYWAWAFILIAVGVGAMFALSAAGGIGGRSGHSMWWGLLILPYPAGWLMAFAGAIVGLMRLVQARRREAPSVKS